MLNATSPSIIESIARGAAFTPLEATNAKPGGTWYLAHD
jgi:hypothetical protein